jgi:tRNA 2-selenouridine synthase
MSRTLSFADMVSHLSGGEMICLDVRSPGEYAQGHIPGTFSLPLFSDEERKVVGTLYKQDSPNAALLQGLDYVGPRMSGFVRQAAEWSAGRKILLYCWRGGKRSQSMAWLLSTAGMEVYILEGGYKAFRREVLSWNMPGVKCMVLGGFTGSRKSRILECLKAKGEEVMDLERLAHHKGSAFGNIGEEPQPSQEQFENELFLQTCMWNNPRHIWIEDESKAIGKLRIPNPLFEKMRNARLIFLKTDRENRLDYIAAEYGRAPADELKNAILKLKKRLGGLRMKLALEALEEQDIKKAASIILEYYDQTYAYGLSTRPAENIVELDIGRKQYGEVADHLIRLANEGLE